MKPWVFAIVVALSTGSALSGAEPAAPATELRRSFGRDLPALAAPIRDADRRSHVVGHLEAVELLVERLHGPDAPEPDEKGILTARVLEIVRHLNQLHGLFSEKTLPEERDAAARIDRMLADASEALVAAAGIELTLKAGGEPVRPGAPYFTEAAVSSPGILPLSQVALKLPDLPEAEYEVKTLSADGKASWRFSSPTPRDRPAERRGRFRLEVDELPRISVTIVREVSSLPSQHSPGAESR